MADHSKPLTTSTYANFVTELDGRFDDLTLGLDPANTSPTNLATNAIRFSSAVSKWQKYDGTTWADLASSYAININGTVGATTPAAGSFTDLSSTGNTTLGNASGDTVTITGTIQPGVVVSGSSSTDMFRITQTGTGNAFVVEDAANPDASPFVVDTDGNVGIGTTSPDGNLEVSGTATSQYITRYSTDTSSARLLFRKSRGTEAARTTVVSGDNIGELDFSSYDGTGFTSAADIIVDSEGTIGTNRVPGRMLLRTGTNASPTVVATAIEINSSQVTNFTNGIQVNSINAYALKTVSYKTGSGTYTTPSKVRAIYVECVGGGGGGGGVDGSGVTNSAAVSGGGGGGGAIQALITSPEATYTFAVGAAGSGGAGLAGANGATGGTSSFTGSTATLTATGGGGGIGNAATTGTGITTGGSGGLGSITGSVTSSSILKGIAGGSGQTSGGTVTSAPNSGCCPLFGGGMVGVTTVNGTDATVFGEGGSSTRVGAVTSNYRGGDGFAGTIRITEYY